MGGQQLVNLIAVILKLITVTKTTRTVLICENNIMHINCEVESVLSITRANYGRFSIAVCNDDAKEDINTNCESMNRTTLLLKNR